MATRLTKYRPAVIYVVLAISTLAIYCEVRKCEFVNYDDEEYVSKNEYVGAGLTADSIRWAFTSTDFSNWHPLTWLSHMLDSELFGLNGGMHHVISLIFHIANALLLFAVLKQMAGALWPSAFVAAAFALHPLHVESVAWVSERKDVLSTFFWILTMGSYHIYVRRAGARWYLLTLAVFATGLMAKPMLVTLPFVLLLLDYWPLGRFANSKFSRRRIFGRLVLEKVPFFALSVVSSAITFFVQQGGGAVNRIETIGPLYRIANAFISYMTYIVKMIWPSGLAVFYPHRFAAVPIWQALVSTLLLLTISVCVIYLARKKKYLLTGWLWYLGTLVPVIGLVQVGSQAMADRYSYVPLMGLFIMIGWGFADLSRKWRHKKIIVGVSAAAVLAALAVCTRLQVRHWHDSISLYEHAIEVTDDNFVAYAGLGAALCDENRLDEGIRNLTRALQIMPKHHNAYCNMALAMSRKGKFSEAVECYRQALRIEPDNLETRNSLARAIEEKQEYEQAMDFFERANSFANQDKIDEAVEYYKKAVELKPNFIIAQGRLGLLLAQQGRIEEAIDRFRVVLSERPDDYEMHFNVGVLLERQDKIDEAISKYRQALEINPDYAKARVRLEEALSKQEGR